ncbi:MAG: membrane-bound lytic murein transglycosylase MltF [Desulfobacteraceae bacterium]
MNLFFKKHLVSIVVYSCCIILTAFCVIIQKRNAETGPTTLERIRHKGRIRLLTTNSANSYYLYRGAPAGFEYELASEFADSLGVDLDIITPGWNSLFYCLEQGQGDFIASGITITPERQRRVEFSIPYMTIQQRLIHHKLIFGADDIQDLEGRTIHVRRGTSYHNRLEELKQMGIGLSFVLHDNLPTEELIRMVSERRIKFTVADTNIALLNRRYYPDIRIGIPIQGKQSLAWAVKKSDTDLLRKMNLFLLNIRNNGRLESIYDKYYGNLNKFDYFDVKKFHERINTRLPRYRDFIRKESEKHGLDWLLVTAVIYQESHFNPKARSFTNVRGLMQVTMDTAREMGIDNRLNPFQSIKAGIKYLKKMFNRFEDIDNRHQRMQFALASYNIGYGHIRDVRKIARERGLDPNEWENIKAILPLLTQRKIYKKTEHGYARGREPIRYVDRIMTYYDILKQKSTREET